MERINQIINEKGKGRFSYGHTILDNNHPHVHNGICRSDFSNHPKCFVHFWRNIVIWTFLFF